MATDIVSIFQDNWDGVTATEGPIEYWEHTKPEELQYGVVFKNSRKDLQELGWNHKQVTPYGGKLYEMHIVGTTDLQIMNQISAIQKLIDTFNAAGGNAEFTHLASHLNDIQDVMGDEGANWRESWTYILAAKNNKNLY